MLVKANWTGKDEYHQSKREAFWVYNEVKMSKHEIWHASHTI